VIEIKTKLDKTTLINACKKIERVKAMPKTAFYPDPFGRTRAVYGKTYRYVPTVGMIFAYDSTDLPILADHFMDHCP